MTTKPITTLPYDPMQSPRRPEVPRLAEQLKRQNPGWSAMRCLSEAKLIVTSKPQKA